MFAFTRPVTYPAPSVRHTGRTPVVMMTWLHKLHASDGFGLAGVLRLSLEPKLLYLDTSFDCFRPHIARTVAYSTQLNATTFWIQQPRILTFQGSDARSCPVMCSRAVVHGRFRIWKRENDMQLKPTRALWFTVY